MLCRAAEIATCHDFPVAVEVFFFFFGVGQKASMTYGHEAAGAVEMEGEAGAVLKGEEEGL